ncbi:hypothetical protein SAMD00019534_048820 [Acytostelium subglobosum LB1]|uniref:hypothetical protein n=1 Tax=Acytostelium subglobosum LB1 TaxID=1410327 RepID=UPI000644D209|nr:hypothetical protein SAMD00019534_048820 [Acytostelium subglobosum LB1]GAM21707.1 hypothetical protein SAMD00019534_048820 [Acytostelium subglobosum LB1]|eukprot:XP_012755826.1 hypothetical protein SAMD00019534_048820 [Acytostelium subglobosum LB1]
MIKTSIILAAILLVALVSANTENVDEFSGVVVASVGKDAIRAYAVSSILSSFNAVGTAIYGSITNSSVNAAADANTFTFQGGNNCFYAMSYNAIAASIGSGININATSFSAAYFPTILVEYVESNGQAGFQNGTDTIVGWTRLDRLGDLLNPWDIKYVQKDFNTSAPNGKTYPFNVILANATSPRGLVTFRFAIPGAPVNVNGVSLTGEQTKIDIEIRNYFDASVNKKSSGLCNAGSVIPFTCGSTGPSNNANSRLALISFVAAAAAEADVEVSSSTSVHTVGGDITAALSWVTTVDINGTGATANVITQVNVYDNNKDAFDVSFTGAFNVFANVNAQVLVQSFDAVRPNLIVWDPTFGGRANSAAVLVPTITVFVALAVALLL